MKSKFKINELDCANCAANLERAIQKIEEIKAVSINFIAQRMEIEYDKVEETEIIDKIRKVIKREEPDVKIEKI